MRSNPKSVNHHVSAISDFFAERFLIGQLYRKSAVAYVEWLILQKHNKVNRCQTNGK